MKKVYLTLCLLALMFLSVGSTPAFAADWYYVGTSDNGEMSTYIDNSSVIKNSRNATVWIKNVMSDGSMSINRIYVTHTPKTMTLLSYTNYDSHGNVVDSEDIPSYGRERATIVPDTVGECIWYCIWPY